MAKKDLNARKARGVARKALACMASIALVVGLTPGVALADEDPPKEFKGNQTTPIDVPSPDPDDPVDPYVEFEKDEVLEAAINYIIRVDEVVGATLSAQGAKGQHRENGGKTYQVTNKGERVYLTIDNLQEGYHVLGAYSVLDGVRTALEFDKEKGQYYYVVPNGGGVVPDSYAEPQGRVTVTGQG